MSRVSRPSGQQPLPSVRAPGNRDAKIKYMQDVGKRVIKAGKVVPDCCSPTYLKNVKTTNSFKCEQLKTKTNGVKAFFSGQSNKLPQFLASIRGSLLK